ncbi:hypothetical protein RclHR1_06310005 [Rhizophagus clarus]|uniref:Uncharacterized protein n=1 Tax=Rhizophagus clarus TaxID=94130 RepID=A0A2Z6SII3_9GLOM|nr:hypothetical protein RclHR1_06310005 [Rhizophagus clarus]
MITEHETKRQAIQQLWNQGIRDVMEIHNRTKYTLSTDSSTYRRPKKITTHASRALGQYIRQGFYSFINTVILNWYIEQ